MVLLDYVVLVVYFLVMLGIGLLSMLTVKKQEDFFMGSRTFGKLFQIFAAFGAGTGSHDPVAVGRTTFTSGLSGIWSVLLWLFVTPFYWIAGVWYRRMRHLTLADWFVERYQSKSLGLAFMFFGIAFYMVYLALGFSAIGKVGAPLVGIDQVTVAGISFSIETILVLICALVVLIYGVLGGLRAAYWTDLIQGIFIIVLSVLLIPAGLNELVDKFGDPDTMSTVDGFRIMHEQVPDDYFKIIESPRGGEFPFHYILAITFLNLIAIVVHPHMIATGGGSAKNETSARVGLVFGNFLKRLCTIGWSITILIVLALMADNLKIAEDPDRTWGVAAREILGPFNLGLVGLMLACLMAAMMSSASCYMLVVSALVVRNFYAAYIHEEASEKTYVLLGRIVGMLVIVGGVTISLYYMNVFEQLKIAWEMPILFAATFWVGMFWRRATRWAAWGTVLFSLLTFFLVPAVLPTLMPSLADNQQYAVISEQETTIVSRPAAPSDAAKRRGAIKLWNSRVEQWLAEDNARTSDQATQQFGECPKPLEPGEIIEESYISGGQPVYWTAGVDVVEGTNEDGQPRLVELADEHFQEISREEKQDGQIVVRRRVRDDVKLQGRGRFNVDFLVYDWLRIDLSKMDKPLLETMRLPTRVILPFVVIILLSLVTPRVDKGVLDRFYVKMKTVVNPDPALDAEEIRKSYENPARFDHRRLFKSGGLEMQRPTVMDVAGFVISFAICFLLIAFTVWVAKIGG